MDIFKAKVKILLATPVPLKYVLIGSACLIVATAVITHRSNVIIITR